MLLHPRSSGRGLSPELGAWGRGAPSQARPGLEGWASLAVRHWQVYEPSRLMHWAAGEQSCSRLSAHSSQSVGGKETGRERVREPPEAAQAELDGGNFLLTVFAENDQKDGAGRQ